MKYICIFFLALFSQELSSAVAMQVAQFGLSAVGDILGGIAKAKEEVFMKTEGYKAELVNLYQEVTNIKEKVTTQLENSKAISLLRSVLIREEGKYLENQTTNIDPILQSINTFFSDYLDTVRNFLFEYSHQIKESKNKAIAELANTFIRGMDITFRESKVLFDEAQKVLYEINHHISGKEKKNSALEDSLGREKGKVKEKIDFQKVIDDPNAFLTDKKDLLRIIDSMTSLKGLNADSLLKTIDKMNSDIATLEARERNKDITNSDTKVYSAYKVYDACQTSMTLFFDELGVLMLRLYGCLEKIGVMLVVGKKKIDIVSGIFAEELKKNSSSFEELYKKLFDRVKKSQMRSDEAMQKYVSEMNEKKDSFTSVFNKLAGVFDFFNKNKERIDTTKSNVFLSGIEKDLAEFFKLYSGKNTLFQYSLTAISYINELKSAALQKIITKKHLTSASKEQDLKESEKDSGLLLASKNDPFAKVEALEKETHNKSHGGAHAHNSGGKKSSLKGKKTKGAIKKKAISKRKGKKK
jgi:regulator of replication initiation timing